MAHDLDRGLSEEEEKSVKKQKPQKIDLTICQN